MNTFKATWMTSARAILCFTIVTGVLYPLLITLIAKFFFPAKATGSLLANQPQVIGSELLAQSFTQSRYFWPRPSANNYDSAASAASNLGPTSAQLIKRIQLAEQQGLIAEMRYTSGSGLDPHISPLAAKAQIARVAKARSLNAQQENMLLTLVGNNVEPPQIGFLGEPRVNVLKLNLQMDETFGK